MEKIEETIEERATLRYLITGATGFIGPHLIKKLVSMEHECRCLVRSKSKTELLRELDVDIVEGDITNAESLEGISDGVDCIFHMATLGHLSNFKVTEATFNKVNVQGTINVMQEAIKAGVQRVIHCSSVAAMGICSEVPATEESDCRPHHSYGRSKHTAEKEVIRMVSEQGLPAVIVRFSMVYGPGDWRDMLKLTRMTKKGLFPKVGNRPKLTPLIHVDDAIKGLLLAAEKGRVGEVYLIANQESMPFDEIRKILQKALGVKRLPLYVPEWMALSMASFSEKIFPLIGKVSPVSRKNIESTLADRVFSIDKAKRELGFEPGIEPHEGLRETVAWYKQEGWV
ncbi:NAD-dependent epimerase/dehydratase family protein [Thermodesulfobacteriota bacterium]